MTYLDRAIKDGYAIITGPENKQKIIYVTSDNHTENYNDPEEKVRAEFWAELIYEYDYPAHRIKVEVTIPDRVPTDLWGDRIFEKCGIGRDEGGDGGKTLKYAGNGDFRRGTEARIINNLEMRMRRRRSALFSRPRGRTTAAARRGAHIRRIRKSPGNARITAFLRLLDDMSRSAPSRKSQQQTKRTRASRLMLLL